MASDWAAKLAQAAPPQPKAAATQGSTHAKPEKKVKTARSTSGSPPPSTAAPGTTTTTSTTSTSTSTSTSSSPSSFNAQEVKQFLQSNFDSYSAKAREDKDGEQYKIYRSLESSNQWETKVNSNPRNVLRNRPQSNTVDILFEINRSIFQQRQEEKRSS
ncbi:hypothetical protein KGF57_000051 [Candida theae]|uniref:Uncharacterized protein n=1 Tax=Candida theae TaxID=1198502 RepID=A0AAD5BL11_9ASCO|nr:uncharacterized protein KGF57_000051 [Candida theae]KAI5968936.1 hypothetical protein KGF57_000051 [Candida theae]